MFDDLSLLSNGNSSEFNEEILEFGSCIFTLTLILSGLFIFGILFNLISIFSIILAKAFTRINILIINLAIADITYALGIPMFLTHIFSIDWPFGVLGCRLFFFADYIGMIVGVFTVSVLSIERFFDIADKKKRFELYSSKFKMLVICIIIVAIWLIAILFPLPIILSVRLETNHNITTCRSSWNEQKLKIFFIIKFLFIFLFPFTIISISSAKLLVFFNEWRRNSIRKKKKSSYESNNSYSLMKKNTSNLSNAQSSIGNYEKSSSQTSYYNLSSESNINLTGIPVNSTHEFLKPKTNTSNYLQVTQAFTLVKSLSEFSNLEASKLIMKQEFKEEMKWDNRKDSSQNKKSSWIDCNMFSLICHCGSFDEKDSLQQNGNLKRSIRRKASRLVLIIVLFFFIEWIPLWIFHFYDEFFHSHKRNIYFANILITVLSYSNTVVNPLMYMLVTYNFKSYCRMILKKKIFLHRIFSKKI